MKEIEEKKQILLQDQNTLQNNQDNQSIQNTEEEEKKEIISGDN